MEKLQKICGYSLTGDYERLTYRDTKLNNNMYGYRDTDFLYTKTEMMLQDYKLDRCSNTTNDSTKLSINNGKL